MTWVSWHLPENGGRHSFPELGGVGESCCLPVTGLCPGGKGKRRRLSREMSREELELHTQRLWRCGKWKEEQPGGAGTMNCRTAARSGERAPPLSPAQPWRCISVGHGAGEEQQGELSPCWSVSEDYGSTGGHSCPPAPCWGSITCIYCHRVCPYWCRLGDVLGPLVIPQL